MSTTTRQQVAELEKAILNRARELADEFSTKAKRQRDSMLMENKEKLRIAEEREVLQAKVDAQRLEQRKVQASALKLDGRLDQLRWELVQAIQARLPARMAALRADRDRYREWLSRMISEATALLPEGRLTAEVTTDDLAWLQDEWPRLITEAAPGREITLNTQPTWGHGGIRLRNEDNTAQVDNRFEGRLGRLEPLVQRVIIERLFSGDLSK